MLPRASISLFLLILVICPSLFSMVDMARRDYSMTDNTISLELCDSEGQMFTIDKMLGDSFSTVKNCLEDAHKEATVPVNLDAKELALFLHLYKSGQPDLRVLVNYTFDELLSVLRAVEYLGADEVKEEVVRKLSISLTSLGLKGGSQNPSFYENIYFLTNVGLLTLLICSYLHPTNHYWAMSKIVFFGVVTNGLLACVKNLEKRVRLGQEQVESVGDERMFQSVYFEKETLKKLAKAQFNDATKCDIILPCIVSNKRLCRLIKGLPVALTFAEIRHDFDREEFLAFISEEGAKKLDRMRTDSKDLYKLLQETLGDGCLQVLVNRLP